MNAFESASLVEAKAYAVLMPYLEERSYQSRFVKTAKGALAKWLQEQVGDVLMNVTDEQVCAIEIKAENTWTKNLFLEVWSNRNLESRQSHADRGQNRGWLDKLRADVLLYYFLDEDILVSLPVFSLKRWAFGHGDVAGRLYDYPEKRQGKWVQMNDTWGRCVPVKTLIDEAGARATRVRQLSLLEDAA